MEELDRKPLSRDLDGRYPFLDPRKPIEKAFAERAASRLNIPVQNVAAKYEALAERLWLRLEWRAGA